MIVPQASKIQHTTTIKPAQKIGLYRYLDFSYNRYDPDEFSVDEIGVENDALLKQFNSMINNYLPCLPHSLYEKYIGHIVIGNLEISRLYRIKDDSIELEKLLQEPYKESLEKLMSQLREVIVDDQTMEKLKNIEGIAPYLAEDNEKGTSTYSLETLTKSVERSSEREQDTRLGHSRESGNPVLLGPLKITDLHVMRMGSEGTNNWTFVKIETDAGICG